MLYQVDSVRKLEKSAIVHGVSGDEMMKHAGEVAFKELMHQWPDTRRILVLCGGGNNGGDGFVVAECAQAKGLAVQVLLLGEENKIKNEALRAFQSLKIAGVEVLPCDSAHIESFAADVIVDALLGIGMHGNPRPEVVDIIDYVNGQDIPVMAVDVPSGLNADTAHVEVSAIIADMTVTFIAKKQGMFTADGPDYCGEIVLSDLDLPTEIYQEVDADVDVWDADDLAEIMPARVKNTNKGDYGHVVVVGGYTGMSGAAILAGLGALRVGAGLVSIATHPEHAAHLSVSQPEIMCHAIADGPALRALLEKATTVVLGPGLGRTGWSEEVVTAVMEHDVPMVVDADGLYWLSQEEIEKRDNWVLTPHPGEAARLIHYETCNIQQDRFAAVKQIQEVYGGTILLKGCGSIISDGDQPLLCPFGNPGMASGGMGDLLAGMIAGLIAQDIDRFEAVGLATYLHALAGDMAAEELGECSIVASDLLAYVQQLMKV